MRELPDCSIKLIVTDPPYKTISGGSGRKGDGSPTGILSKNDGKIFEHNAINFKEFFNEAYRVLETNSHMYVMTNFVNLEMMLKLGRESGFDVHNLLVWEKNTATPNRWYMKNVEYTIFFRKGKAFSINNCGSKTSHSFNNVRDREHPTQKPVDLMAYYIENSSEPNDVVLDPFMGSGTTAIACLQTGRKYTGFEIDLEYYNKSLSRIDRYMEELNGNILNAE